MAAKTPWRLLLQAALAASFQVQKLHVPKCSAHSPGMHLVQMPDIQRQFLLVVPEEYTEATASGIPLVLAFHGFGDSPSYSNRLFDFSKHINRYGWLGILPFGLNETGTNGLDGVDACCPEECQGECCMNTPTLRKKGPTACGWRDPPADALFVEAILKWATQQSCADPSKVFAAGFSNGGMFVNYLACHASHLPIQAFAPVSGDELPVGCNISRPISYLSMCGTSDDQAYCQKTANATANIMSSLNGCFGQGPGGGAITLQRSATSSCKTWDRCPQDNFVEICTTQGLAHDVSGHLRPDNTSYIRPASDLDIAEYIFQKFSLLVNGTMLFWGHPTAAERQYKKARWPFPRHFDHPYIRRLVFKCLFMHPRKRFSGSRHLKLKAWALADSPCSEA